MKMKEVTVTWLWQHNSTAASCRQRGQRDPKPCLGCNNVYYLMWHLLCYADLTLTHCCSWCRMMKLQSSLPRIRLGDQRDLRHFVFVYFCNDWKAACLKCRLGPKIDLPAHHPPNDSSGILTCIAFLAWFVNCISVLWISAVRWT